MTVEDSSMDKYVTRVLTMLGVLERSRHMNNYDLNERFRILRLALQLYEMENGK